MPDTRKEHNRKLGYSLAKAPQLLKGLTATQQLQEMLQTCLVAKGKRKNEPSIGREEIYGDSKQPSFPCPVASGPFIDTIKIQQTLFELLFVSARMSAI